MMNFLVFFLSTLFIVRFLMGLMIVSVEHLEYPLYEIAHGLDAVLTPVIWPLKAFSLLVFDRAFVSSHMQDILPYCDGLHLNCSKAEDIFIGRFEWVYLVALCLVNGVHQSIAYIIHTVPDAIKNARHKQQLQSAHSAPQRTPSQEISAHPFHKETLNERMLKESIRTEVRTENRQLISQYKASAEKSATEANTDTLTGLMNRRGMSQKAILEWYRAQRSNESFHIALLDIDNFKQVNDTYGHVIGDQVIQKIAQQLNVFFPEPAITFRFGGEELGMMTLGLGADYRLQKIDQCRKNIAKLSDPKHPDLHISVSIGLLSLPSQVMPELYFDETKLFAQVDELLYQAKAQGKNRVIQHIVHKQSP